MDDVQTINILKGLVIDGVHKANSGHPGGAMSSSDFAYILYTEFLNFDPKDPLWLGRDRFVLSAGHESMLLYALLYMCDLLPLEELRNFRQLHSKTPGHPEVGLTPGVECTTGPLGQGAAMSVGMAMAAKHHGSRLDQQLFSGKVYSLLGDGCMQEDITYGAASYAGHLKLNNLIWFYDRNGVQISGEIGRAFSDDSAAVYRGLGWHVIEIDGHDHKQIRQALSDTQTPAHQKPTLIIGTTRIGNGAYSMSGSHETHGAPLPQEERIATKRCLNLPLDEDFYCPPQAKQHFQRCFAAKSKAASNWRQRLADLLTDLAFKRHFECCFGDKTYGELPRIPWNTQKPLASRNAFGEIIVQWADALPNLVGGSADLEPSNMTGAFAKKVGDFQAGHYQHRNFAFGVREFPMSAVSNGLALYGGLIPFDATFLTFSDYSRPALRLGAIQGTRVIHEFTHDSFHLGEDGPTHQPVEHIMSLRVIPDLYVMRPADAFETEAMMAVAVKLHKNTALCLTRQALPFLDNPEKILQEAPKGAYALVDLENPDVIIFATGSEVHLALNAAAKLSHIRVKVVSMPCWELFAEQPRRYQDSVLSLDCKRRVSIEAGSTLGWERFVGMDGLSLGRDTFGDSAPSPILAKHYGFDVDSIVMKITKKWF